MSRKELILLSLALVVGGVISRLMPHPWNVTPLSALGLFASAYLGYRYSAVIVFLTMAVSDLWLGFYHWPIMLSVYVSFMVPVIFGLFMRKRRTAALIMASTLGSSFIFFLVTNWAVWQFGTMYPHSLTGLLESYTMAIPFFKNSLLGDIFYTGLFFGAYELFRAVSNRWYLSYFAGSKAV